MSWFERILHFIWCLILTALAVFLIPIVYQILLGAIQAASTVPSCNEWTARLIMALGVPCALYQAAVQGYGWLLVLGFTAILLGLIICIIRCWLSLFKPKEDEEEQPNVTINVPDYFGVQQGGVLAQIHVTPPNTVVNLQSSDPGKVKFAQASINGSGSVPLVIGATPSAAIGDVTLTAVATNSAGTDTARTSVTVVELSSVTIEYPLRLQNNGTFTSQAGENRINLIANLTPIVNALSNSVTWQVDDDPRDAIDSGNPVDPAAGINAQFTANPPASPNGRRAPLSYRIQAKLTINSHEQDLTEYAAQDEIDQCRQEYIDMNKNTVPNRGDFVDAATYVDPGNFPFNEINSGDYNVAVYSVANHLQNIRNRFGQPMTVNSGFRNPVHNADIGGARESQHMYGTAADIAVRDFNGDGGINANMVADPNFGNCGDDWAMLANEARTEAASFVEPWNLTGNWVHMDWR